MRNVERAKQIAKSKGVSFAFVCTQIGKSRGYLAEILANNRDIPEKMLEPVAQALGITVEELTGESEQKEKPNTPEDAERESHGQAILDKYNMLDPATQAMFEKMLDAALEAAKGKENG
jgi:transcriptional regulator with XRE-family HTH domain